MNLHRLLPVALALSLSVPVAAYAQETDETAEAQLHFHAARSHYDAGRLDDAIREYQLSYELSGRPEMLYNIHLAHRDAGRPADAARFLSRFLDESTELSESERATYQRSLVRLERAGRGEEVVTSEPPETAPAPPHTTSTEFGPAPWVLVGVGAGALAGSLVTGLLATSVHDELASSCGPTRAMCPDGVEDRAAQGQSLALATDVLWPVGSALVITGIILWAVDATAAGQPVEAACGPAGCAMRVRF